MTDEVAEEGAALAVPPGDVMAADGGVVDQEQVGPGLAGGLGQEVDVALGAVALGAVALADRALGLDDGHRAVAEADEEVGVVVGGLALEGVLDAELDAGLVVPEPGGDVVDVVEQVGQAQLVGAVEAAGVEDALAGVLEDVALDGLEGAELAGVAGLGLDLRVLLAGAGKAEAISAPI